MRALEYRLTEEQLEELKMSPTALEKFAFGPEAEGILTGFEVELVVPDVMVDDPDDYEAEPDYDYDERCNNINQVVDFFVNGDYGIGDRAGDRLRNDLDELYMEWYDEQMRQQFQEEASELIKDIIEEEFDKEEFIRSYLIDKYGSDAVQAAFDAEAQAPRFTSSKEQAEYMEANPDYANYLEADEAADLDIEERAEESFDNQDGIYDQALDKFREDFYLDDDSGFFSDNGLRWMSDVANNYDLSWPYLTNNTGGTVEIESVAKSLEKHLGFPVEAGSNYHSVKRSPGKFVLEPDMSIDSDNSEDAGLEIVSPPMPIKDTLIALERTIEWAQSNHCYTNSSTGLHMGVSLPKKGGEVDYIKLALFLGDEHVLEQFGRSSNNYCQAAMKHIRNKARSAQGESDKIITIMDHMRKGLNELASKAIASGGPGKYTSINTSHGKYIEFRSAGGDYLSQESDEGLGFLKNTLLRYVRAMAVAGDPTAETREYSKKLYKLIAPASGDVSLDLFSRFASGTISKEELKTQWAENALAKDNPEYTKKSTWVVFDKAAGKTVVGKQYSGYTYDAALVRAKQDISPGSSMEGFKKQYDLIDSETNTGRWSIVDRETGETLEIVDAPTRGAAADLVYDKYTKNSGGFFVRPYVEFDNIKPLSPRAKLARRIKEPKIQANPDANVATDWEAVYEPTGRVIDTLAFADATQAKAWRELVITNHGFDASTADKIIVRRAGESPIRASIGEPEPIGQQTYSNYADAQRAADAQNQRPWDNHNYEIYMPRFGASGGVRQFHANNDEEARAELERYRAQASGAPNDYDVRPLAQNESCVPKVFEDFSNYYESIVKAIDKRLV